MKFCRNIQNYTAHVAFIEEPYIHKDNFYLGNIVNPVFVIFDKNEITNSRGMPNVMRKTVFGKRLHPTI